jgi:hypothetical protein
MQQEIQKCEFFLVTPVYDDGRQGEDELIELSPINRVREILGGRWERSSTYMPTVKAFFNGKKRVLVMGFPVGTTREQAQAALRTIQEGREDLS